MVKTSEQDDDPYVARAHYVIEGGSIVEADFAEGDGLVVRKYNAQHYVTSETLDADGPEPILFVYDRDPISNVVTGAKMSCVGSSGPTTRSVPLTSVDNDAMKDLLIAWNCGGRR